MPLLPHLLFNYDTSFGANKLTKSESNNASNASQKVNGASAYGVLLFFFVFMICYA